MAWDNNKVYQIDIKGNMLMFETTSFKAERGSILHSGIYNRELASSLAAGACITAAGFFFAYRVKITAGYFFAALILFVILFLMFRTYVFREPLLRLLIDKDKGDIEISAGNILSVRKLLFPAVELEKIRQDYVSIVPENPDGVKIVENISLQHGTVIPGFGKTLEFYTVELEFKNSERIMIFSSGEPSEADEIAAKIKNYLKIT